MREVKILLLQRGISAKSNNPYCHLTVRSKKADGTSVSADFWLSDAVMEQVSKQEISEDDFVQLGVDLNENLRPEITKIVKVEGDADNGDLIYKGGNDNVQL